MSINIKNPEVVKDVFSKNDFNVLKNHVIEEVAKKQNFEEVFSRYSLSTLLIDDYAKKITPLARKIFNSNTLMPSYSLFSHYEGIGANLFAHKDDNACTYTLDLCVYQNTQWGVCVEGNEYFLEENEALAFYGVDQEHWRKDFPDPKNNKVGFIFFHFVEPEHWFFTKGSDYVDVLRGLISEEEWNKKHNA